MNAHSRLKLDERRGRRKACTRKFYQKEKQEQIEAGKLDLIFLSWVALISVLWKKVFSRNLLNYLQSSIAWLISLMLISSEFIFWSDITWDISSLLLNILSQCMKVRKGRRIVGGIFCNASWDASMFSSWYKTWSDTTAWWVVSSIWNQSENRYKRIKQRKAKQFPCSSIQALLFIRLANTIW